MNYSSENFSHKRSCSSSGQSEDLNRVSTDLTSNERSRSAVIETSQSHSELSTLSSSDCDIKDMSNPSKGMLLVEAQNANTISSPIQVKKLSILQTNSSDDCARGHLEIGGLLDSSPVNKWITYPLVYPILETDDRDLFLSRLIWREKLRRTKKYPAWFMHIVDIVHLFDLVQRYVSEVLAQVFTIRIEK
jgi:hypothetical protein